MSWSKQDKIWLHNKVKVDRICLSSYRNDNFRYMGQYVRQSFWYSLSVWHDPSWENRLVVCVHTQYNGVTPISTNAWERHCACDLQVSVLSAHTSFLNVPFLSVSLSLYNKALFIAISFSSTFPPPPLSHNISINKMSILHASCLTTVPKRVETEQL